jgi:uncharacterized protein (TIGR03437 family)
MNRFARLLCLRLLCLAIAAAPLAHSQVSGVFISMGGNNNITFTVDGQSFSGAATFLWPKGSKHTLSAPLLSSGNAFKTQYGFQQWVVTGAVVQTITDASFVFTADPQIQSVVASFTTAYEFDVIYFDCPTDGSPCQSPGTIYINNAATIQSSSQYVPTGSTVSLRASPNPGYIFTGWSSTSGTGNTVQTFINAYVVNAPLNVYPSFKSSRPIAISLTTSPADLKIIADSTTISGPANLDWGTNTVHSLGAVSPQTDNNGNLWVFSSWSDGGAMSHAYTVPGGASSAIALTATFLPASKVTFLTNPTGLKLTVNGRDNWPSYTFTGAAGTKYQIAAAAQQLDSRGRINKFVSWSNGGAAAQTYIQPGTDDRLTATYQPLGRVTVTSAPSGLALTVNGKVCQSPCTFDGESGTQLSISAPASIGLTDSSRLDFAGWTDSNATDRIVTMSTAIQTLTANYQMRYRVSTAAAPSEAGAVLLQPVSGDGYYNANVQVQATVSPNPGFQFRSWQGDATGPYSSVILNVNTPKVVAAAFNRVPYLSPAAVQNAAGTTPVSAVAPGSVVSLFGLNLASDTAVGPTNTLAQTLLNVIVLMGNQILPLYFVSPQQINVQLPFATDLGPQMLTVHQQGQPDVTANFTVVRNAPGLFAVTHQDGTAVTAAAPAGPGETVQLIGTGLGPYDRNPPDGFTIPAGSTFSLVDPVTVTAGSTQANLISTLPSFTGVGLTTVAFQVPDNLESGATVPVRISANGVDSNSISLFVQ